MLCAAHAALLPCEACVLSHAVHFPNEVADVSQAACTGRLIVVRSASVTPCVHLLAASAAQLSL